MADPEVEPLANTELGVGVSTMVTANERPSTMHLDAPAIPGYRITAVLGEGGMGTVYAAEQDAPRRSVAIKVLQSRSGSALARFQGEAEIMARLDHPGIARVLEAGEADGHPFLVMEHVDGKMLDDFAKDLTLDRKLELFGALCEAVQHAHLKGVIHRDLKPSNVMVRSDDDRVIVLDFGVARLAVADDNTPSTTRAGELIGTPLYMSPEQARLRADEVDVRTDVYTLGVMLYELICGELPYNGRDAPLPILTCLICEDPPIPLSKRGGVEVGGDLDAITLQALQKEPAQRYQSVAALAEDVRRFREGQPVSVRVPTTFERARAFVRRRPVLAASILGSGVALAAFAAIVTVLWLDASRARSTAEAAQQRTETARAELESRSNQLILRQARVALGRDPTEALAWLATLTPRDVDVGTAWEIAHEALARGVAKDVLKGHADEVHWVEALPGGFVSSGYDGRVIVWDPTQRPVYAAKTGRVHLARPSPDGAQLAVGGDDGDLRIISRDGTLLAQLPGHEGDVQHLAWTRDGAWLASADDHGIVLLWPHARGPARQLASGGSAISDVVFSADGTMVTAGDHDGHLWQWDVATGTRAEAAVAGDIVQTWSDGAHAAAVDGSGLVHWWKREGNALVVEHTTATGLNCKRAVWASDGAWAVLGGVGGIVTRADVNGSVEQLAHFHAQARTVAISSDGRWIAAGADDGELEARDRTTGQVIALHGHTGRIRHVTFAEGLLLSSDSDGVVRRWDLAAIPPTVLDTRGEPPERMTSDGSMLAWVDASGQVGTWSFGDDRYTQLGKIDGRATAIAIVDGVVVTGTTEGSVTWWSKQPVHQVLKGAIVRSIATAHGIVAVASSLGPLAMFSATGEPRPALAGHPHGSDAVAIDPTGTIAASGGQDRVIRVWRIADGTQLAALDGPNGDTHFVIVTADRIVAGSNGGTVLAWPRHGDEVDAKRRTLVFQHTGAVTALAISHAAIVSAGRDAVLERSRLGPDRIEAAETTAIPNAALAVGVDDRGTVRAVTRNAAAIRWNPGEPPVVEIDHGVHDGTGVGARWVEAFDDGTFVVADSEIRSFDQLREVVRAATSFQLPH
ncbi:MAG: serine/threonine-protein kinase [Kofleriaceae bacterium]